MLYGVLIAIGTYMMITKKEISQEEQNKANGSHGWLFYAVLSAVFASIDVIPAKNADPNAYNTHIFSSVYASVNSVVRSSKPPFF